METQTADTYDFLALEERILDYFNFIRSTALRFSNDSDRAEDFAQEAICKIIKAQPNHAALGPKYFKEATVSVIKDAWQRESADRRPLLAFVDEVPESMDFRFSPERAAVMSDTLRRVQAICTSIEWEVITMSADGYSVRAIGAELGISRMMANRLIERVVAKAKDQK